MLKVNILIIILKDFFIIWNKENCGYYLFSIGIFYIEILCVVYFKSSRQGCCLFKAINDIEIVKVISFYTNLE